jgi:hypothetical protein
MYKYKEVIKNHMIGYPVFNLNLEHFIILTKYFRLKDRLFYTRHESTCNVL